MELEEVVRASYCLIYSNNTPLALCYIDFEDERLAHLDISDLDKIKEAFLS